MCHLGQTGPEDVGQELTGVETDFCCLMEKERRRQHARRGVGIVQEDAAVLLDEAVNAGIHVEAKEIEQALARITDSLYIRRRQVYRCHLPAQSCQVFGSIIEDLLPLPDFCGRQRHGWTDTAIFIFTPDNDTRKLLAFDEPFHHHFAFTIKGFQ